MADEDLNDVFTPFQRKTSNGQRSSRRVRSSGQEELDFDFYDDTEEEESPGDSPTEIMHATETDGCGSDMSWEHSRNTWRNPSLRSLGKLSSANSMSTNSMRKGTGNFRRNSQLRFSDISQSVIIFDWDDTLFPTYYVRDEHGLRWDVPLEQQEGHSTSELQTINGALMATEKEAIDLIRTAMAMAKVMIVTLARSPWIQVSCQNFYPDMGAFLEDLNIPLIYAQDALTEPVKHFDDYDEAEAFWSEVKGRAIEQQLTAFYSQYEGQTWKNIISIGDSDFERLGTINVVLRYMESKGLVGSPEAQVVGGHVIKVRSKTFKMMEEPSAGELRKQIWLVRRWLPLMVVMDRGFDLSLEDLSQESIEHIQTELEVLSVEGCQVISACQTDASLEAADDAHDRRGKLAVHYETQRSTESL